MQVPRVTKITLNMGVGEAKTEAKALDGAIEELTTIAGQRAQVRPPASRSRASSSARACRSARASRCAATACRSSSTGSSRSRCPRIRDFRGLDPSSFDGRGNYSLGIREQIIFPEIDYDDVAAVRGLDVAITTTAQNDDEGFALLRGLGLPFREREGAESG